MPKQIEDPTDRVQRELDQFGIQGDTTFLTTSTPSAARAERKAASLPKLFGSGKKESLRALEWAVKKPTANIPNDPGQFYGEGKHHLNLTAIQKMRQVPKHKRKNSRLLVANQEPVKPSIRALEQILDTVNETQGLQSDRTSGRQSAGTSLNRKQEAQKTMSAGRSGRSSNRSRSRESREDVKEILDVVQNMIAAT